ncbi:MAG: DUF2249 domain-containing protein [Verrucomicrobia bacterium]|nr:DUF2249 domain-containing protein [Verrucomicrobiota bacterium]
MKAKGIRRFTSIDVRLLMAGGEEPRDRIMAMVAELGARDGLEVISPFLPAPLIERLQTDGFTVHPERRLDGSWVTRFWRE